MMKELINVCAYCRVSTNKEEQEQSFDAQQKYFKEKLSKKNGYKLIEVYADQGLSGTKFRKRTAFNEMLHDAGLDQIDNSANVVEVRKKFISTDYLLSERKPKFDTIYVKDSSRFARNNEVSRIINKLRDKGVYIYFEDLNKSTENDADRMIIDFIFSMAYQESVDKSRKIKFGNERSAEAGKIRCGGQLYGYTYNKEDNTLREVKEEADVIRRIFNMRLEGKGSRVICNILKEEGIKTKNGKDFITTRILSMLKNATYMGKLVRNKTTIDGMGDGSMRKYINMEDWIIEDTERVDQIIDEDTFNKVQELIINISVNKRGVYIGKRELCGKIKCGKCGNNYVRFISRDKYFYRCSNKVKDRNNCDNKNIREDRIYEILDDYIKTYKEDFENEYILFQKIIKDRINDINKVSDNEEITDVKNEINKHKEKLSKIIDIMLEDDSNSSKELFTAKRKTIDDNIKVLEKKLSELTADDNVKKDRVNTVYKIANIIKEYRKSVPDNLDRTNFIKKHLKEIIIKENGSVKIITTGTRFFNTVCELLDIKWDDIIKHNSSEGIEML